MQPGFLDFQSALTPAEHIALSSERSHYAATLQSYNSSEGSGTPSTASGQVRLMCASVFQPLSLASRLSMFAQWACKAAL